ncbi:MAG: hypothetical protein E6767_16610 [Dysgonomonas sp.]|nr:hypothetical protein [Dysgonomonas sp.]
MNQKIIRDIIITASITVLFFFIFIFLIERLEWQDITDHAKFSLDMMTGKAPIEGNLLLYLLVHLFTLCSTNLESHVISICALIAIGISIRYVWVQHNIYALNLISDSANKQYWLSVLIALSLLFVYAIPIPNYFLRGYFQYGAFVPNLWNNSTTIFLFPFAIVLFYKGYQQIEGYKWKRDLVLFLLILLNVFIKPSFFFVFIIVYPLFMLYKYKFNKTFWLSLLPLFLGGLCVLLEYYTIYIQGNKLDSEPSFVVFSPLDMYNHFAQIRTLPFSLIFSMLFPLTYYLLNFKEVKNNLLAGFVFVSMVVAILIFLLINESGPRGLHSNFYWQIVICVWLFFYQSLIFLLTDIKKQGWTIKNKLLLSLYSIHVIIGVIYLIRMYITGTFF